MADKILRIIFSGISTLHPGPAQKRNEKPPDKAFVLMAANSKNMTNAWGETVEPHFTFVYVPESVLVGLKAEPDQRAEDKHLGTCNIYYLENARVTFDPRPEETLDYYTDPDHDLGERPGSDDVANEDDIRWLMDLHDVVSDVTLKSNLDAPGPEVAAIVELTGGTLKAGFPCKSVQTQTFKATPTKTIPRIKRVLASEFSIEMTYPETTLQVKLRLQPLRMAEPMKGFGLNELTLQWPKTGDLEVRMGNDTKLEAGLASTLERCNARVRTSDDKPIPKPRDDDFFLHYELLNIPPDGERPLPQAGPHQTTGDRCKPAVIPVTPVGA